MSLPDSLKDILLSSKFITQEEFESAKKTADDLKKPITDILIFRGLLSEDALGQLIAEYYHVPYIKLRNKTIPSEILHLIPEEAARSFRVLPFARENGVMSLAMENPQDLEATEFVKRKVGSSIKPYFTLPAELSKALGQYKRNIKELFNDIVKNNIKKTSIDPAHIEKSATDIPVIKILDAILEYAAAENASDIHLDTVEGNLLVRFRIDGVLRDILVLPKEIHPAIVARIKILSHLKIDEHRIPQDGRFKLQINDDLVAFRVSIVPAFFGENIVLRLLAESARPLSLEELGLTGKYLALLKENIKKPHGMILVTGPTGSGKTTTLYSILNMLNTPEVNICTIEDPIEYGIRRVNQMQVNTTAGLTFAAGLRSLLRHDPNIIMVGEIRDSETAETAIHSALTGHLVLTTLHTNNAAGAIPRFLDMGAEGFLVASTVNLIIAQRLVRRICTVCMEAYTPTKELLEFLHERFKKDFAGKKFYHGNGCTECHTSGYKGRIGVYELLAVDATIQALIAKKATVDEIEKQAVANGMVRLLDDGFDKVSAGLTTIDEVMKLATS